VDIPENEGQSPIPPIKAHRQVVQKQPELELLLEPKRQLKEYFQIDYTIHSPEHEQKE
jgi:hypothetical protein